jgi:hypothetical protein
MADIFISYASEDQSRVEPLSKALKDQGWSVFWDRTIPAGKTWRQVIGDALETARSVIVAWSKTSVDSRWVQEEADRGLERNILIPILIDNVRLPLGFGTIQAVNLVSWEPTQPSPEFEKLIADISAIIGPSPIKVKEAEQKRTEEERRRKQDEERKRREERQRLEEEKQHLAEQKRKFEEEQKRIEAARKAEEERKQKEAEAKRKADEDKRRKEKEELKRRKVKAELKTDKPEPEATAPSEPRKTSNALILGVVAGVIVLLMTGGWLYYKYQQKQETLPIANKEKELLAARNGKIFVETVPDDATVKILNIDETFQQGMKLETGKYHVKVSSEGYEPQDRWIELDPGKEKRINFELQKMKGVYLLENVKKGELIREDMLQIFKPEGSEEISDERPLNFKHHLRGARFKRDLPKGYRLEWGDVTTDSFFE